MNQPPAVDALSDDVLLHIFSLFVKRTYPAFLQVLAVSHVSQRWPVLCELRNSCIAIDCPELWRTYAVMRSSRRKGRPPTGSLEGEEEVNDFKKEMILRCRGLTLDAGWRAVKSAGVFRFRGEQVPPPDLAGALQECAQFRSLTLFLHQFRYTPKQSFLRIDSADSRTLQQCVVPALEELIVDCSSGDGRSNGALLLPSGIFKGNTPALRSLRLMGAWIDLAGSGIGRNLHTLAVQVYASNTRLPTTLQAWAYVLRSLPALRSLAVHWSGPEWGRVPPDEEKFPPFDLTLPHLAKLEMTLYVHELRYLMAYISMPVCQRLFITLKVKPGDDVQPYMGALVDRYALPYVSPDSEVTVFDCPKSPAFAIAFKARSNLARKRESLELSSSPSSQDPPPKASVHPWWEHNVVLVLEMQDGRHTHASRFAALISAWKPLVVEVPTVVLTPATQFGGGRLGTQLQPQPAAVPVAQEDLGEYMDAVCRLVTARWDLEGKPFNLVCGRVFEEQVRRRYMMGEEGGSLLDPSLRPKLRFIPL